MPKKFNQTLLTRRDVTRGLAAGAAAAAFSTPAIAQGAFPTADVHFICAFPPGSGADVMVRYMAEKLRPMLNGHAAIVENKPGALGNISTEYLVRSKPDGHTILIHGASGVAAAASLLRNPTVDVSKTIQLVGTINKQPTMMAVHANSPYKTVADVTAAMKQKKEKGTYATTNPVGKVMGAIYTQKMELQNVEVQYKTAPDTLNDLASGAVDYIMSDNVFTMAQVREGRLRVLAVSTDQRMQANADIPTMTELGVPMNLTGYFGLMVPTGTPQPVMEQLSKWTYDVVSSDETRQFLAKFASDPWPQRHAEAQAYYLKDIEAWKGYVEFAKIEKQG